MSRWSEFVGVVFVMLVACSSACATTCAAGSCPPAVLSYWFHFQGADTGIPSMALDTTIVDADGDTTRVSFDRATARLAVSTFGRMTAGVRVPERFVVTGVPIGTLVPATIEFVVDGEVHSYCDAPSCGVRFAATLAGSADSVIADAGIPGPCGNCSRQLGTTLRLPVTIAAGTPLDVSFALLFHTTNVQLGAVTATGAYRVSGLPVGVNVVTCTGTDATPVRRRSWGSLKASYR